MDCHGDLPEDAQDPDSLDYVREDRSEACLMSLWEEGFIPIEFRIAKNDIAVLNPPSVYFTLASRFSYLPLAALKVVNRFRECTLDFPSHVWFESEVGGIALKSNYPIGVLHDIYRFRGREIPAAGAKEENKNGDDNDGGDIEGSERAIKRTTTKNEEDHDARKFSEHSVSKGVLRIRNSKPNNSRNHSIRHPQYAFTPWRILIHFHRFPDKILHKSSVGYSFTTISTGALPTTPVKTAIDVNGRDNSSNRNSNSSLVGDSGGPHADSLKHTLSAATPAGTATTATAADTSNNNNNNNSSSLTPRHTGSSTTHHTPQQAITPVLSPAGGMDAVQLEMESTKLNASNAEKLYFHSLKQALYLIHGHTRVFNAVSVSEQRTLWQAVQKGHLALFESVASQFMPRSIRRWERPWLPSSSASGKERRKCGDSASDDHRRSLSAPMSGSLAVAGVSTAAVSGASLKQSDTAFSEAPGDRAKLVDKSMVSQGPTDLSSASATEQSSSSPQDATQARGEEGAGEIQKERAIYKAVVLPEERTSERLSVSEHLKNDVNASKFPNLRALFASVKMLPLRLVERNGAMKQRPIKPFAEGRKQNSPSNESSLRVGAQIPSEAVRAVKATTFATQLASQYSDATVSTQPGEIGVEKGVRVGGSGARKRETEYEETEIVEKRLWEVLLEFGVDIRPCWSHRGYPTLPSPFAPTASPPAHTALDSRAAAYETEMETEVEVIVHGIVIGADAPIYQLWSLFCHGDLFLYITLRRSERR